MGKTTLQEHVIDHLLRQEQIDAKRIFHVQFDELPLPHDLKIPLLSLCYWFEREILGGTFNEFTHKGEPIYLFFDEVQNLSEWAPQIKALVDHHSVRVLLTGSSALRIEQGRDSLAGRISTLEINTLLLREIAALQGWGELPALLPLNGLQPLIEKNFWQELREHGRNLRELRDRSFEAFAERGGYPIAQVRSDRPWEEVADQLNETVIRRVIQHDLRAGERGRNGTSNFWKRSFAYVAATRDRPAGKRSISTSCTPHCPPTSGGNACWLIFVFSMTHSCSASCRLWSFASNERKGIPKFAFATIPCAQAGCKRVFHSRRRLWRVRRTSAILPDILRKALPAIFSAAFPASISHGSRNVKWIS